MLHFKIKKEKSPLLKSFQEKTGEIILEFNRTFENNLHILEDKINELNHLQKQADLKIQELKLLNQQIQRNPVKKQNYPQIDKKYSNAGKHKNTNFRNYLNETENKTEKENRKDYYNSSPDLHTNEIKTDMKKDILRMASFGVKNEVIAKKLSINIGEVELILSLQKKDAL